MAAAAAGEAAAAPAPRRVSAVVFDMDGTLTVPVIDFQLMYDRVGVPRGHDVLAAISEWPAAEQQRALDVIAEFEEAALRDMQLMPGVVDLARLLDDTGIPRALVTRNVCKSVDHLHAHHIAPLPPFLPALSRNTCVPKPAPDALLRVAEHWGVPPTELLMVGDSARDDVRHWLAGWSFADCARCPPTLTALPPPGANTHARRLSQATVRALSRCCWTCWDTTRGRSCRARSAPTFWSRRCTSCGS